MSRIYVASSWRNERQLTIVGLLRGAGHQVYDFREPTEGARGFHWSDIDPAWQEWTPEIYRERIQHTIAQSGFSSDMGALKWATHVLMVKPCGASSHLELGWAAGQEKVTGILLSDGEPELMYRVAGALLITTDEVLDWARQTQEARKHEDGGA